MGDISRMETDQRADGDKLLSTSRDSSPHPEPDPKANGKSNLVDISNFNIMSLYPSNSFGFEEALVIPSGCMIDF